MQKKLDELKKSFDEQRDKIDDYLDPLCEKIEMYKTQGLDYSELEKEYNDIIEVRDKLISDYRYKVSIYSCEHCCGL